MFRGIVLGTLCLVFGVLDFALVRGASVEVEFRTTEINECGTIGEPVGCTAEVRPYAGGTVLDGFVTTDADILSLRDLLVAPLPGSSSVMVFNVDPPFGSDTAPPEPALVALNQALEIDSWATTPGLTVWEIPPLIDPVPWYEDGYPGLLTDDSDDGPQDNFHFVRLTFPTGGGGVFSGEVVVAGSNGPEPFAFSFTVPEPSSSLLFCLAVMGCLGLRHRSESNK